MNICIVGTGYVGLVSAACFAEMGNHVSCVDINPAVVERLRKGEVHIYEPGLEVMVRRNAQEGRLTFTTDLAEGMKDSLFLFCCVGTPEGEDGSADLQYVFQVASDVGKLMTGYMIISGATPVSTLRLSCSAPKSDEDEVSMPHSPSTKRLSASSRRPK